LEFIKINDCSHALCQLVSKGCPSKAPILPYTIPKPGTASPLHLILLKNPHGKHKCQKTVKETCIQCEWEHLSSTLHDSVQLFFTQRENEKLTHYFQNTFFFYKWVSFHFETLNPFFI